MHQSTYRIRHAESYMPWLLIIDYVKRKLSLFMSLKPSMQKRRFTLVSRYVKSFDATFSAYQIAFYTKHFAHQKSMVSYKLHNSTSSLRIILLAKETFPFRVKSATQRNDINWQKRDEELSDAMKRNDKNSSANKVNVEVKVFSHSFRSIIFLPSTCYLSYSGK